MKRVKGKVVIQAYWGAEVSSIVDALTLEKALKKYGNVHIADVIIDDKLFTVVWNGEELRVKSYEKS